MDVGFEAFVLESVAGAKAECWHGFPIDLPIGGVFIEKPGVGDGHVAHGSEFDGVAARSRVGVAGDCAEHVAAAQ